MDNCCLNLYGVSSWKGGVIYEVNAPLEGSYPNFYSNIGETTLNIVYNEETSLWYFYDGDGELASTTYSGTESCPDGLNFTFSFEMGEIVTTYTFTVYQFPCDLTPVPPTIDYPLECVQEPCRNKNLFRKQKGELSKDIAGVSKKEIFGFKCGDAWENIFMRNLIIHALSCMPTGVLSVEKEKCLIGKLTDKCNC